MPYDLNHLQRLREKYGWCSSWAVWADQARVRGSASGISDLSVFDIRADNPVLAELHCEYILVALNLSRDTTNSGVIATQADEPAFANFHSAYARSRDFQLHRALKGTPVWGAWMADIIKGYPKLRASEVVRDIREGKVCVSRHVADFEAELACLGALDPVLIAFGRPTETILRTHLVRDKYKIFRVTHYSAPISSVELRAQVLNVVAQTRDQHLQ